MLGALALLSLAGLSLASLDYGIGGLDDVYRLKRLYELSQLQQQGADPFLVQDLGLPLLQDLEQRSDQGWGPAQVADEDEEAYEAPVVVDPEDLYAPLYSGAQARDPEHMAHSSLQGVHKVAGGTAEGEPPKKQVKTDKPLPAYCNPPNPCPVGKTAAADNCVENFQNTMENNQRLLRAQDCPCDREHMWSCPAGQETVSSKGGSGQAAFTNVMSQLAGLSPEGLADLGFGVPENKHEKLVAKKSPGMVRRKRSDEQAEFNPYFEGKQLAVAAKKGSAPALQHLDGEQ